MMLLLQVLNIHFVGLGIVAALQDASLAQQHDLVQRALEAGTWALETRDALGGLGNVSSCSGCQSILSVVKGIVANSDSPLISLGKQLCLAGTSYDDEFCNGAVELEVPAIADIIRIMDVGSKTSLQFCIAFLGVCDYPKVDLWQVPFPSRSSCQASQRSSTSGRDPIKVVQYSDIHIDEFYVTGSSTECDMPTCCRVFNESYAPGKTKFPAGPYGDHRCDSPTALEQSMYKAIEKFVPDAALTIFTGDIIGGGVWNTSKPYNEAEIEHAYDNMNDHLHLVYGTAGNHESNPANIFEPNSLGNETQWVYDALSDQWSRWIGSEAEQQARKSGAYSTKYPKGNLRIISLNTNIYYQFNFILFQRETIRDPNGQIAWLVSELDAAEKAGENVWIIGHMPFGLSDTLRDGSNYLDQVVNRYSETIKAMFFGHTHRDHFEISYSNYSNRQSSNAVAMSYICPALTPTSGMPSFRVYEVDPVTFAVLDFTAYIANMSSSSYQTAGPVWEKYYTAKEVYGSVVTPPLTDAKAELTPAFWHNVTEAFVSDNKIFFDYMSRKTRGWEVTNKCNGSCKTSEICQLRAARSQDNCETPTPGVHFTKRTEPNADATKYDKCGVPVFVEMFRSLAARQDLLELLQREFLSQGGIVQPFKRGESMAATESGAATGSVKPMDTPQDTDCAVSHQPTEAPSGNNSAPTTTNVVKVGGVPQAGPLGFMAMLMFGALAL